MINIKKENIMYTNAFFHQKGLCLVATQDFSPLEIVLHDEAAVAVPYSIDEESCIVCLQELEVCCLFFLSSLSKQLV